MTHNLLGGMQWLLLCSKKDYKTLNGDDNKEYNQQYSGTVNSSVENLNEYIIVFLHFSYFLLTYPLVINTVIPLYF